MQSVTAAFTAEERDPVRNIVQNTQVSWKRFSTLANRTFTIGVSTIGGNHVIGINPGAIGSPSNYKYFDESSYVLDMSWERGFNLPAGGLTKALAEVNLDNTSGRFTPRYMGGNSELYTSAYLPRRPLIINAGFDLGVDITIPQFAGITTEAPELNIRDRQVKLRAADYIDYFQNKSLDQASIFTSQRTDQIMTTLMSSNLGMNTAQYDLDYGINLVPFAYFPVGTKFSEIFHSLASAENAHFYQDETGVFKFENRNHWASSPYNAVQRIISTAMVINAEAPNTDHLINVVEVKSKQMAKQPEQTIYRLNSFDNLVIPASSTVDFFFNFDDPVLSLTTPTSTGTTSYFVANTISDGTGTDISSKVVVAKVQRFAYAAKISFTNTSTSIAYITSMFITGRIARSVADIYTKVSDSSSVTAFDERLLSVENPYIQSQESAETYANMILSDFSSPENLQKITIRAIPELQMGDLISWQGRYWRVFDIKATLSPDAGFIQELLLLQRSITSYFRIGISTIGGSDRIGP